MPRAQVAFREVEQVVETPHHHGHAWATINRRLKARKPGFACGLDQPLVGGNPVTPRHVVRRGRPLPKALSRAHVQRLCAQITPPRDRALLLVMRRGGRRVSEAAPRKLAPIAWAQPALPIEPGKGRKDRRVYLSPEAVASRHQWLEQHPGARAHGCVLWNRQRPARPLSVTASQKTMERSTKAAGITASGHRLRQTLASNLLEHGAEVVTIRDFWGQSPLASRQRSTKLSHQQITLEDRRTMQKILKQGQV